MHVATKQVRPTPDDARRRLRVLIVDEDRDLVQVLMTLLKDAGYEPHGVYAGRYVVASVIDIEPDVVVLSTSMPDTAGSSMAQKIRALRGNDRPVLIGVSEASDRFQSLAEKVLTRPLGFKHYLTKPFAPEQLLELLKPLRS